MGKASKLSVLTVNDEVRLVNHMLKHGRSPLDAISHRKHYREYYLNPQITGGIVVGSLERGKTCLIVFRNQEIVVKNLLGKFTLSDFKQLLSICQEIASERNCSKTLRFVIENEAEVKLLMNLNSKATVERYDPGQRPIDKGRWQQTLNRTTFTHVIFIVNYVLE